MPKQRRKSNDPVQESLREHKSQWNGDASSFIASLIAFKRGLNGRGDPKGGIPPSTIKEPLSPELGGLLSQLASQFQEVMTDAGSIISEQAAYSKNRRKSMPKTKTNVPQQMPETQTVPSTEQTVNTLSRLSFKEYLMDKYGSSRGSRAWQYIKPFSRQPFNKDRLGLLSNTADLFYSFRDFENEILSIGIDSIPGAISKYKIVKYNIDVLKRFIDQISKLMKPQVVPPETSAAKPPAKGKNSIKDKDVKSLSTIERNLHLINNTFDRSKEVANVFDMLKYTAEEQDPIHKKEMARGVVEAYHELLAQIRADAREKNPKATLNTLQDIINAKNTIVQSSNQNDEIIKLAHNFASRFLKRQLMKLRKSNKTAVHRLRIVEQITQAKNIIQKMMDGLEKQLSPNDVQKALEELDKIIENMKPSLLILETLYKEYLYNRSRKNVQKDKRNKSEYDFLIDQTLERNIRNELRRDLI